jgi:hypothetical protein
LEIFGSISLANISNFPYNKIMIIGEIIELVVGAVAAAIFGLLEAFK